MSFPYKHVLLVGATAGIGRAFADRFIETGLKVTAVGRRKERLDDFVSKHGQEKADGVVFDISETDKIPGFVDSITKKHPDIDLVLLNAGVQRPYDLTKPESISMDKVRNEFDVNFFSIVAFTNAFLPFFFEKKTPTALAFTTSNLSIVPASWVAFYSATKAALNAYILCLRENLRNHDTRVIDVSPPAVQTELHDYMGEEAGRNVGMPLDKYIDEAHKGLLSGKDHVIVGAFAPQERFFDIVDKRRAAFDDLSKMYRSH